MESHQEVNLSNSPVVAQPLTPKPNSLVSITGQNKEDLVGNSKGFIGVLDVFIHQARDIHNICIYHKQDVYAKIYLTSYPEISVSTQTINGGGQNPVFNENLRLSVQTVDSTLKCEIWMLSRVRNYLQDQLLGFALVPLCDVLKENGKLAQEFELSSSDLFHSPSGFVKLSIAYTGSTPEVLEIPAVPSPSLGVNGGDKKDSEVVCELNKIEFPDPNIANENEMMVTEYYAIPSPAIECESLESCDSTEKHGATVVKEGLDTSMVPEVELPPTPSSGSARELRSAVSTTISETDSGTPRASKSMNGAAIPSLKEKKEESGEEKSDVSVTQSVTPLISINVDQEPKVVQQDFVDMYMNSMKQFTEALAKMKLPLDIESGSPDSGSTESNGKVQAPKGEGPSPRVFYGSRAFF